MAKAMLRGMKILFAIFMLGCSHTENAKPEIAQIPDDTLAPDQISYNLKIDFVDSSFTKAVLTARRGRIFAKENYSLLDSGVKVTFFSTSGGISGVLTADEVNVDEITKNMFAKGNVVVVSDSTKSRLETSEMEWKNKDRKLYSDAFVCITTPKEIIQGYGFISDENLSNYKIFKVSGVMSNE